jgi:hypothetical protein
MRATRTDTLRGSVVLEALFGAVVLWMLLVATLDLGRINYFRANLQHAVSQATRFAASGETLEDPNKPGLQLSPEDSIVYMIRRISAARDLTAANVDIVWIDEQGRLRRGAGRAGKVVTVLATYDVPLESPFLRPLFHGGRFRLRCASSFRDDRFHQSATSPPESRPEPSPVGEVGLSRPSVSSSRAHRDPARCA